MSKPVLFVLIAAVVLTLAACGGGGGGAQSTAAGGGGAAAQGNVSNGDKLFHQASLGQNNAPGCATCHATEAGKTLVGPTMANISGEAAEIVQSDNYKGKAQDATAYVHESIVDPNIYVAEGFSPGIMYQNYGKDLSEGDINDLVAYLTSLK